MDQFIATDRHALTIRFFAAARAAAGVESTVVELPPQATLGDLEALLAQRSTDLARVLERCSYLRDGRALCDRSVVVGNVEIVDVLPPFAGG